MKVAAADPTSRATGVGMGIYEREVRFYRSSRRGSAARCRACHLAAYTEGEGWFTLLLEDVAPALQGDQIAGCSIDQARLVMSEMARVHAPVLGDPALAAIGLAQPALAGQPGARHAAAAGISRALRRSHRARAPRAVRTLRRQPRRMARRPARLPSASCTATSASTTCSSARREARSRSRSSTGRPWAGAPAMADAAYFLGGEPRARGPARARAGAASRVYHEALRGQGVDGLALEECWDQYRRHTLGGVLMALVAPMVVERTERGDDMFMTMIARHAQHALDLEAADLLPPAGAGRPAPLRPEPGDEEPHEPGREELWNESWYFDAVSADAGSASTCGSGSIRTSASCWYTAFVCRPGRAFRGRRRLRGAAARRRTAHRDRLAGGRPRLRGAARALPPSRSTATGEAHRDRPRPLRGEPGAAVPVELDLDLGDRRRAVRLPRRDPLRDPLPGVAGRSRSTARSSSFGRRPASAITRGARATGGRWTGSGAPAASTTARGSTPSSCACRTCPRLGLGYVQPPGGELDRARPRGRHRRDERPTA